MFLKKQLLNFWGNMHGGDNSYAGVQLAASGTLLKQKFIVDNFLRHIWNYSQFLSYLWDNCNQLPIKLQHLLHGNTLPVEIVMCCNNSDAYHCQHILIYQYISIWSSDIVSHSLSCRQLFLTPKHFKSHPWT